MQRRRASYGMALGVALVASGCGERAPSGGNPPARGGSAGEGAAAGSGGTPSAGGAGSGSPPGGAAGIAAGESGTLTGGAAGNGTAGAGAGGASGAGGSAGNGATVGGGAGGGTGDAGMAGSAGIGGLMGGCSEDVTRTAPPAGRESYGAGPSDDRFPFTSHWVGEFSENPMRVGMTSLADLDGDGDLDFGLGQRQDGDDGGMGWFEHCTKDHWVLHRIGDGYTTWAGGGAADLDADGLMDLVAGDSWFRNPGDSRTAANWERFPVASSQSTAPRPEEIIVGELGGDERPELVYVHRQITPQFWSVGADPSTRSWVRTLLTDESCDNDTICPQQGAAIGDLDGDGDPDVLDGYQRWYRNTTGDGTAWETVTILTNGAFDGSPLTALGDLDGDDDLDIVMGTHFGARLAWAENEGNEGQDFTLHMLATDKDFLHTIIAADLDNDGDLDILAGQNVGPTFVFENDGQGAFTEHTIALDTRGHEARTGDVDCDGDLDIVGNPWGDQNEGGEESMPPRDVAYLESLVVDRGGPAIFERQAGEVTPSVHARRCPGR
jgi:hypothetical protein